MCVLCDAAGTMTGCQDCGCLICFDEPPGQDGLVDRAYVTASGEVFCRRCGSQYDREAEAAEGAAWEPPEDDRP